MTETWKAIAGHEGSYEVSDRGRVRSLDRISHARNRWGGVTARHLKGRVLSQCDTHGYRSVTLGFMAAPRLVHRLVADAFLANPQRLPEVNHKNLTRSDNDIHNLEWVSSSDNKHHSYASGTRQQHAKTTPVILTKGSAVRRFDSELAAAEYLGRNPGSVNSARKKGHACAGHLVASA